MKPYLPNSPEVLTVALALLASASRPTPAQAAAPYQEQQSPGLSRIKLADFEVTTLYGGDVKRDVQLMHVVHVEPVQLSHPEITIAFDSDPSSAEKSRQALVQTLSSKGTPVAGPHMPFPGNGHLRKGNEGYVLVPVPYLGSS